MKLAKALITMPGTWKYSVSISSVCVFVKSLIQWPHKSMAKVGFEPGLSDFIINNS